MRGGGEILVTDTLFIQRKHEYLLEHAGFRIVRLSQVEATEAELGEAIKGKRGYILGGIEKVTIPVLAAADKLEVIVFTGVDYPPYIPAFKEAKQRGITIESVPSGPTHAVAEWAVSAALLMNRHLLDYASSPALGLRPVPGLENQQIGIIGYGRVGQYLAKMLTPFRPASVRFYSRHTQQTEGVHASIQTNDLDELLTKSDIVFLCISETGNQGWFNEEKIKRMKTNALLLSIAHRGVIDENVLYEAVRAKQIRAVIDQNVNACFATLPSTHWFSTHQSLAFCTQSEIDLVSTMAVQKMIAALTSKN